MGTDGKVRRMRSNAVHIGAVGILSLALVGCANGQDDDEVTAYCVSQDSYENGNGSYEVVDDDNCDDDRSYHSGTGGFFFFYGGSLVGRRITGGSTVRPKNATIKTSSGKTIQRGGFGNRSSTGS